MSGRSRDQPAHADLLDAVLLVALRDEQQVATRPEAGARQLGQRDRPVGDLVLHVDRAAAPQVAVVVDVRRERRVRPVARVGRHDVACARAGPATARRRSPGSGRPGWRGRGRGRPARTPRRWRRGSRAGARRPASRRPAGWRCRCGSGRASAPGPRRAGPRQCCCGARSRGRSRGSRGGSPGAPYRDHVASSVEPVETPVPWSGEPVRQRSRRSSLSRPPRSSVEPVETTVLVGRACRDPGAAGPDPHRLAA